jgi:hypothetical protein
MQKKPVPPKTKKAKKQGISNNVVFGIVTAVIVVIAALAIYDRDT